jgi:hypothetical protein
MKTYLSVDCDFWTDPDIAKAQLERLIDFRGSAPIIAVTNHQQMLDDINISKARKLINIDAHSDLDGKDVDFLNCATWISYVAWRGVGEYSWIRPRKSYNGSCNSDFRKSWNHNADWKISSSTHVDQKKLDVTDYINGCVGIGICMSPAYSSNDIIDVFKYVMKKNNIKIIDGDWKELSYKRITPSGFIISKQMILNGYESARRTG